MEKRNLLQKIPNFLCLFILGLISAAGYSPINFWPLYLLATAIFLTYIFFPKEKLSKKQYFFKGWWFGLGQFVGGLYWVSFALTQDERFLVLIPAALFILPAILACYTGLSSLAFSFFKDIQNYHKPILFAVIWTISEYLRAHLLTGFPWGMAASTWSNQIEILQSLSFIGSYGLGFLTILMSGLITLALLNSQRKLAFIGFCTLIVGLYVSGYMRINSLDKMAAGSRDIVVKLVQPNIAQKHKWKYDLRELNFQKLLDSLRVRSNEQKPALIIWPETAITSYIQYDLKKRRQIANALPKDVYLISGAIHKEVDVTGDSIGVKRMNSLFVIDSDGEIVERYDKSHLVPFGEYVPFSEYLSFLSILPKNVNHVPGEGLKTMHVMGISFSPLICYEAIFPNEVVDPANRPEFLLHITNDAWYGYTSGPFQHFEIAKMRAVEEGLPVIRVANTGVSGVIDSLGRVRQIVPLEEGGSLTVSVPLHLKPNTFYAKYHFLILCIFCIFLSVYILYYISLISKRKRMSQLVRKHGV